MFYKRWLCIRDGKQIVESIKIIKRFEAYLFQNMTYLYGVIQYDMHYTVVAGATSYSRWSPRRALKIIGRDMNFAHPEIPPSPS